MLSPRHELDLAKCDFMLATCACLNLLKASRVVTQIYDEALQPSGLRSTQLPVLITLATDEPMTISNLANELLMERTSLARLLRPLEIAGLIKIAPGEDRRTRGVSLTERGQDAIVVAIPLWEKAQTFVVDRLGRRRWRDLRENLSAAVTLVQ